VSTAQQKQESIDEVVSHEWLRLNHILLLPRRILPTVSSLKIHIKPHQLRIAAKLARLVSVLIDYAFFF
jgi:hypothetical protein